MAQKSIVLIDPVSPEFNRGSFCYLPYIYYNWASKRGEVIFYENFSVADIDEVKQNAAHYVVALWSYPQIEAALVLDKFLPKRPVFIGYYPLIEHLGLIPYELEDFQISQGMFEYPDNYHNFDYLMLSDCDMHLSKYSGDVYPMFTSYGCPRGCSFCPSTVNCNHRRIHLDAGTVKEMLDLCQVSGVTNIHFTDEDFFFDRDRAAEILQHAEGYGRFKFIALGSVDTYLKFVKTIGTFDCLKLVEIGFETADEKLGKAMGKQPVSKCHELISFADTQATEILWLTLTFFPGETVKTLNETGSFLRQHGFKVEELYGRIRTNGTEGGLGQFFQPYHGTKDWDTLHLKGHTISPRPLRLLPSFLPDSFLQSEYKVTRNLNSDDEKWFDLYRIPFEQAGHLHEGKVVDSIKKSMEETQITLSDAAIVHAILARLSVITAI